MMFLLWVACATDYGCHLWRCLGELERDPINEHAFHLCCCDHFNCRYTSHALYLMLYHWRAYLYILHYIIDRRILVACCIGRLSLTVVRVLCLAFGTPASSHVVERCIRLYYELSLVVVVCVMLMMRQSWFSLSVCSTMSSAQMHQTVSMRFRHYDISLRWKSKSVGLLMSGQLLRHYRSWTSILGDSAEAPKATLPPST